MTPPRLLAAGGAAAIAAGLCVRPPFALIKLLARRMTDIVFYAETQRRLIALSLDDGPDPAVTPQVLDVLARHDARATFFVLGRRAEANAGVLERIVAEGHELGNHGWDEEPGWRMGAGELDASLRRTAAVLEPYGEPRLVRPGSGWVPRRLRRVIADLGYRCVLGSVYPQDGTIQWPRYAVWDVLRRARPGAIIVLHEGGPNRAAVVGTLDRTLSELRRRGYTVTTVSALLDAGMPRSTGNPVER